jgi:hypothetical protein
VPVVVEFKRGSATELVKQTREVELFFLVLDEDGRLHEDEQGLVRLRIPTVREEA